MSNSRKRIFASVNGAFTGDFAEQPELSEFLESQRAEAAETAQSESEIPIETPESLENPAQVVVSLPKEILDTLESLEARGVVLELEGEKTLTQLSLPEVHQVLEKNIARFDHQEFSEFQELAQQAAEEMKLAVKGGGSNFAAFSKLVLRMDGERQLWQKLTENKNLLNELVEANDFIQLGEGLPANIRAVEMQDLCQDLAEKFEDLVVLQRSLKMVVPNF